MSILILLVLALATDDTYDGVSVPSFAAWRAHQSYLAHYANCNIAAFASALNDCGMMMRMRCTSASSHVPQLISYATRTSCDSKIDITMSHDTRYVKQPHSYELVDEVYRAWQSFIPATDLVPFTECGFEVMKARAAEEVKRNAEYRKESVKSECYVALRKAQDECSSGSLIQSLLFCVLGMLFGGLMGAMFMDAYHFQKQQREREESAAQQKAHDDNKRAHPSSDKKPKPVKPERIETFERDKLELETLAAQVHSSLQDQ